MNSERILWWLCISIIITIEIVSGQRVSGKDFFHCMVPFLMALAKCKKCLRSIYRYCIWIVYLILSFSPVFTAFHISICTVVEVGCYGYFLSELLYSRLSCTAGCSPALGVTSFKHALSIVTIIKEIFWRVSIKCMTHGQNYYKDKEYWHVFRS